MAAVAGAKSLFSRDKGEAGAPMRGLTSFIADLRNARARELEEKRINKELANIRHKFKDGGLNGYQRKKYVCKLLYIYILGWNVDFGHLEAVNLISAGKYSEKQIGYLAVTLFLHEDHELLHLVVNSIRKDLNDHNELFNCLALHAIANVGSKEMAEALAGDVHRLLISPTSKPFVKKKAALTLLRLYRKDPTIIHLEWAERIVSLMDDPDFGVATSVASLVLTLVQNHPDQYKSSYLKAARRLNKIVVGKDCPTDYHYYNVPCPWLQVKLLRLMQYYPPTEDSHIRALIREAIQRILDAAMEMPKNVQQNNTQNAILFEAINLTIHLDTEHDLMMQISTRLGKFIQSRETNVRYLGLQAMTHLTALAENIDPLRRHQSIIIGSLRDRDISVRRQGLDLLYSMCDASNAQSIVAELLKYLQSADYAIREEMVLKIAILTEKYAVDIQWYVDISLRLIAMAGDHVSDEVWQRIIQIVQNNEELQVYAATNLLRYMKADQCHETLVKIGAYILGEFGHLIADNVGCQPIDQFLALQGKMQSCSIATRALVLSCFVKYVNLFPEIKDQLLNVFRAYSRSLDPELQQRACEYLALATLPTDDLLRTVCDEMPPFQERSSALLSRLHQKHAKTADKKTWIVGGRDANRDPQEHILAQSTGVKRTLTRSVTLPLNGAMPKVDATGENGTLSSSNHDLAGLDLAGTNGDATPNFADAAHLSANWEPGYNKLLLTAQGILYQDAQIQVGVRSEYRSELGCVIIYFTNRQPFDVGSFTTTLHNPEKDHVTTDTKSFPDTELAPDQQTQQMIMFEAQEAFMESPTLRITFLAGALQALTLKLPVALHKYMSPTQLNADDFFKRWKQIGGAPREAQKVIHVSAARNGISQEFTRKVTEGFKWGILGGVDPNPKNIVGASVLATMRGGKVGCLLRLEPNYESQMYRVTIRATDEAVPPILLKYMEEHLARGEVDDDRVMAADL